MEAREYLKKIKDDGWYLHDTDGTTRQYVHRKVDGFLTVCVRHGDVLGQDTRDAGLTPHVLEHHEDPDVMIEATPSGVSAYCPDLPGVIATGPDEAVVRERMAEAIRLHRRALQGLPPEV